MTENSGETLLAWLRVADWEAADLAEVRQLVGAARQSLSEDDPGKSLLHQCEEVLWGGSLPRELLQHWLELARQAHPVPERVKLEEEFRLMAEGLPDEEWCGEAYQRALQAIEKFESGQENYFQEWTESMTSRLEKVWNSYADAGMTPEEVTVETVVGHALLRDGVQAWYEAQEMLVEAAWGDRDFEPGLARAEEACRLLAVVQRLARRVHSEG